MVRRLYIVLVLVLVFVAASAANVGAAQAQTAHVAITGGGLTMSNPSVTVVSRNPTQLEVRTAVTDARGTGEGWFLSLAAASGGAPASGSLIVTDADAACRDGSTCTLPVNAMTYPLTASLTGTRTLVYEAAPSSGLGEESIDLHVVAPDNVASTLSLALSLSTPPMPGDTTGSTSPPCSIPDVLGTGTCPQAP